MDGADGDMIGNGITLGIRTAGSLVMIPTLVARVSTCTRHDTVVGH
jgi:hypothetical protein